MKKTLVIFLLFLSACSYAQKVELGLNAGANCVGSLGLYPNNESSSPKAGYYFDFRAAINISENGS
jgi:hypothetical protein